MQKPPKLGMNWRFEMDLYEQEEIEYRFGPRMWDAGEGVCCAYFQTGACEHTESFDYEDA